MSVQTLLLSQFKKSLASLGSEEITIGTTKIQAIEDETTSSNPLGIAAINNERTLVVKFPADAYPAATLKSGMTVLARDEIWHIAAESDSIRRGQVATTITLIEPERRDTE